MTAQERKQDEMLSLFFMRTLKKGFVAYKLSATAMSVELLENH